MKPKTQTNSKRSRAFTLIELAVVNVVLVAGVAVLAPTADHSRAAGRNLESIRNLRTLGAASDGFGADNAGMIFGFDPSISKAQEQATEILSRLTGRPVGDGSADQLVPLQSIVPHRRYQHLVLMDYLGAQLPEPMLASPFDRNQIKWQADPVLAQETTVPYAGDDVPASADRSSNWAAADVRQLWPYASSYQVVPAAWNPNNNNGQRKSWIPVSDTPHLFFVGSGQQRAYQEVAFPSKKVHMFEEFDRFNKRSDEGGVWFAYAEARCNLLFFDGSVRRLPSRASNPGWNPSQPNSNWAQRYKALDTFPSYARSLGYQSLETLTQKYRWTREGLGGIDFGGPDVFPIGDAGTRVRRDDSGGRLSPR